MKNLGTAIAMLAALAVNVSAKKAPPEMTHFNETCPAAKMLPVLNRAYTSCMKKDQAACGKFIAVFRALLPEYDCQRPFDASPRGNYIVPAIWVAGDKALEEYIALLATLETKKAKELFGSPEFRSVLDGDLAETYIERSKSVEKELRHK